MATLSNRNSSRPNPYRPRPHPISIPATSTSPHLLPLVISPENDSPPDGIERLEPLTVNTLATTPITLRDFNESEGLVRSDEEETDQLSEEERNRMLHRKTSNLVISTQAPASTSLDISIASSNNDNLSGNVLSQTPIIATSPRPPSLLRSPRSVRSTRSIRSNSLTYPSTSNVEPQENVFEAPPQRHPADHEDDLTRERSRSPSPSRELQVEIEIIEPIEPVWSNGVRLPTFDESQASHSSPIPSASTSPLLSTSPLSNGIPSVSPNISAPVMSSSNSRTSINSLPSSSNPNRRSLLSHFWHPKSLKPNSSPTSSVTTSPNPNSNSQTFDRPPSPRFGLGLSEIPAVLEVTPGSRLSNSKSVPMKPTLTEMGLTLSNLTPPLSISKASQPTCGAILDGNYLLLGTMTGLDFLPIHSNNGNRPRRPVALIKRTRFKQLVILNERSNILLAVAGRNDHVRVYALDGIRSMIIKKEREASSGLFGSSYPLPPPAKTESHPKLSNSPKRTSTVPPLPPLPPMPPAYSAPPAATSFPRRASMQTPPVSPTRPVTPRNRSRSNVAAVVPRNPPLRYTRSREGLRTQRTSISRTADQSLESDDDDWIGVELSEAEAVSRPAASAPSGQASTPLMPRSASIDHMSQSSSMRDLADFLRVGPVSNSPMSPPQSSIMPRSQSQTLSPISNGIPLSSKMPRSASSHSGLDYAGLRSMAQFLQDNSLPARVETPATRSTTGRSPRPDSSSTANSLSTDTDRLLPTNSASQKMLPRSASTQSNLEANRSLEDFFRKGPPSSGMTTSRASAGPASVIVSPIDSPPRQFHRPTSSQRMVARSASVEGTAEAGKSLSDFLKQGPPIDTTSDSMPRSNSRASTSSWRTESGLANTNEEDGRNGQSLGNEFGTPNSRQRKRWSMLDSVFRPASSVPPSATSHPLRASVSDLPLTTEPLDLAVPEPNLETTFSTASTAAVPKLPPLQSRRSDMKPPRPSSADSRLPGPSLIDDELMLTASRLERPQNPESTTPLIKAESHPASANAPLEYVKLARTKGARVLKGVETKKKTYLAVLCGDTGERIELFTGSRNVSLSLNRTFVLPETPRTIEFQLQGDELIDIYLVYDESVFALEPATVRVREVGVARHERRAARRERERERQLRANAGLPPLPVSPEELRREASEPSPSQRTAETPNLSVPPLESSVQSSPEITPIGDPSSAIPQFQASVGPAFTTFQQLECIPPVPPSVLASSFIIPPTYDSVVASTPVPLQTGFTLPPPETVQLTPEVPAAPLLSPISLLANHPARNSGPPGLFFVSRGRHSTGIVDGDGRSVIRKSINWQVEPNPLVPLSESMKVLDFFHRIETLVVGGTHTVVVGVGATQIQAVDVGKVTQRRYPEIVYHPSVEVIPSDFDRRKLRISEHPLMLRDVTYLAKVEDRFYWTERINSSFAVHCLSAAN